MYNFAPLFVWWLNSSLCEITQKSRTQCFVYCMCVLDNKHGSVERSRMVRLQRRKRPRRQWPLCICHSLHHWSPCVLHVRPANRHMYTHTHKGICRSRYGATLPLRLLRSDCSDDTSGSKPETKTKSSRVSLRFSGGGSENETNREEEKVAECQCGLNNRISEIIAVFFRTCWAHSGRVLHNDYSWGGVVVVVVEVIVVGVWQRWRWWQREGLLWQVLKSN